MATISVILYIPDSTLFDNAITTAETFGFVVSKTFPRIGSASGDIDEIKIDDLRAIPGIKSVQNKSNFIRN